MISVLMGKKSKYFIVCSYETCRVKNIKENVICLKKSLEKKPAKQKPKNKKQKIPKIFCKIIGIPVKSDPAPSFANLFLYFYGNTLDRNTL